MRYPTNFTSILALAVASLLAGAGHAQTGQPAPAAKVTATEMTEGEVRKVDKENGKITLKHGEIKSLDMPPMTMVFHVEDAAVLGKVKPGGKVLFRAASEGGKMTLVEIQPVN